MLTRLFGRQSPHSAFLAAAALLLAFTLILDLIVQPELLAAPWMWLIIVFCLAATGAALGFGARVPIWVGVSVVVAFTLASIYFLSPWSTHQAATSTLQELPILALYLGWFVRRRLGQALFTSCLVLMVTAMVLNPVFAPQGALGPSIAFSGIVIAVLCYVVGLLLWKRIDRKVRTDTLTGVLNRRGFLLRMREELARAERLGDSTVLAVIDFDGLKHINDTRGHAAGDTVLRETAAFWRRIARSRDLIGRTGGDEFALLLERVDLEAATGVLQRLRTRSPHAWSWGVAEARPGESVEALFRRADIALYLQKAVRQ